jgi:hypothetical protein
MSIPTRNNSIFHKQVHPFKQLVVCALLLVLLMGIIKLSFAQNSVSAKVVFWEIAFAILMGYALFNSIFSFSYEDKNKYFRDSVFTFIAIAAIGGGLAYLFSGLNVDEAGSFRWLYVVFGFSYLVFISIVNLMHKIIELVKKQDARLRGEEQ